MKETVDLMALGRSVGHRTQTVPFARARSVTPFLQPGPAFQSATTSQSNSSTHPSVDQVWVLIV